jgi:hypothetical protein
MIIIGGGRIQVQGTRAELLTESGTIVEAADFAALGAALHRAGSPRERARGGPSQSVELDRERGAVPFASSSSRSRVWHDCSWRYQRTVSATHWRPGPRSGPGGWMRSIVAGS